MKNRMMTWAFTMIWCVACSATVYAQGLPGASVRPDATTAMPADLDTMKNRRQEWCKDNSQQCADMKAKSAERHAQCKADPEKCRAEMKAKREERCKADPKRCEEMKARMKERHEQCKADPQKCRDEMKTRFEERCKQNPQRCEEMKAHMKARQERCKADPAKCAPATREPPDAK